MASLTLAGATVTSWQDISGNARTLTIGAGAPQYGATLIGGKPGVNFSGSKMVTGAFPLTQDVTLFAVIQYRVPGQWGPVAHHGSRDSDWSLEHSGFKPNTVMHWQSVNDNANVELSFTTGTNYILAARMSGTGGGALRYFSKTDTGLGTTATTGTGSSLVPGNKILYVGGSDANEFSNHYIGELIYYNRALTDAERNLVIVYLKSVWGI
jgi:hypothetical protein